MAASGPNQPRPRFLVWRQLASLLITTILIAWLLRTIGPEELARAFAASAWPWMVLATVIQVLVLFAWDTFTLWWLFSQPDRAVPMAVVVRVRAVCAIWIAVNRELGQGIFAWKLARMCRFDVAELLGRCLVVALFDLTLLLGLGFLASILNHDPRIAFFRWVCGAGLAAMGTLALGLLMLPARWRQKLSAYGWAHWLAWWRWRHSFWLGLQRLALFGFVLVYAGVGLALCGLHPRVVTVLGVIPLVLIAEVLPAAGGVGPKEATLVWLMPVSSDEQRAVLLSFGLIWSFVVILVRILIGLGGTWFARHDRSSMEQCSVPGGATARPALMNRSLP